MRLILHLLILPLTFLLSGCGEDPAQIRPSMQLRSVSIGGFTLDLSDPAKNNAVSADLPALVSFSAILDGNTLQNQVSVKAVNGADAAIEIAYREGEKAFTITPTEKLAYLKDYDLILGNGIRGKNGETFAGLTIRFTTAPGVLKITSIKINQTEVATVNPVLSIGLNPVAEVTFSAPLAEGQTTDRYFRMLDRNGMVPCTYTLSGDKTTIILQPTRQLRGLTKHQIWVSYELKGAEQEVFSNFTKNFYTAPDPTPVFPVISDDDLLTKIQQQTFRYFWDYAEPTSGMARERNGSGDLVTTGGSGFGLMALVVGMERGFITRQEGVQRLGKILTFLERADRFHGAWSHWVNGVSGKVIPFGANDNGGDLVETSFLVQGLLTVRQYLNPSESTESALITRINALWEGVEWDWYRRDSQMLYWHWSPDKNWIMNMPIRGWNECLISYVLAASSPTHTISKSVYDNGWAQGGGIRNGQSYEGVTLPLGSSWGGPLFFTHYSFLGLKPAGLSDAWCSDYFLQNKNHSRINQLYCVRNPKKFVGYSTDCWGLTASDNQSGYSAHSPTNDLGVITPTAAISSLPYTPQESMNAIRFFYYTLGDRLWGDYGFYDAFNLTEGWTASSYLAIDQGPIVVMVENHRTGLLWNLFMSAPEVQAGLTKLGFTY